MTLSTVARRLRPQLLGVTGLAAFFLGWQALAGGPLSDTSFPYAFATLHRLFDLVQHGDFWSSVSATLGTAAAGFVIAVAICVPLGLLVGLNKYAAAILRLPLEVAKPIPPIVILPLVVYELGPSAAMSRFLIIVGLVPTLVIATAAGVRDVDPVAVETARTFRIRGADRSWRIVLPAAMPFIVTGMRIGAFGSLLTAVMSEIVGGAPGLGAKLSRAQRANLPETAYAYVLAIAVLGLVVDRLVTLAERRLLHWHVSVRGVENTGRVKEPFRTRLFEPVGDVVVRVLRRAVSLTTHLPAGLQRRMAGGPNRRRDAVVLPMLSLLAGAAVIRWWWVASAHSHTTFFAPLSKIMTRSRKIWLFDRFGSDALPSLRNLAIGFAIAATVGIAIGLAIGMLNRVRELFEPVLALFRSLPGVAFVPILITIMGFETSMRVTTIAVAATFPVVIATVDGIRAVDSVALDVAHAYRLPFHRRLTSVYLPAAAPRIFAGLEIALFTAVVVMIASELSGVTVGIGAQTILAQQTFAFTDMWAGVVLLAIIGVVSNLLFRVVQFVVLRWYRGARAAARAM